MPCWSGITSFPCWSGITSFDQAHAEQELDGSLRRSLERALDADLSALRVHTGAAADRLTASLGADALAVGSNVYFRRGAFNERTPVGLRLLAHEAMHVAQQSAASMHPVAARPLLGSPGDVWEQRAEEFAAAFVGGRRADVRAWKEGASGPVPLMQRHVSYEHRALGDLSRDDLTAIAVGSGSRRSDLLESQIKLQLLWHREDPEKVDEGAVAALSPGIHTLRLGPDGVLLTYGELNALPDYFSNPTVLESLKRDILLPILQVIRQESYNQLTVLLGKKNPNWVFPRAACEPWRLKWVDAILETKELDEFTAHMGINGVDHYKGLLSRNACHFAPYSWHRWQSSHIIARDAAAQAAKAKSSPEKALLTKKAWTYHGYADHFLQDSFAAGHLINKTMVMQWWVEWARSSKLYVDNWDLIKDMTVGQQPGLGGSHLYDPGFPGPSNDPQTAEESSSFMERLKATRVVADGNKIDEITAYQKYLAFLGSAVTQLATNVIHDMFNEKSVWVSSVSRPRGFEVWGDDTLFKDPQGREGVWVTSETAELSRQALREILDHGGTDISVKSLRDRFPTKAGDSAESLDDLGTWNQSLRSLCDRELFGDSWTRFKDLFLTAVPRLSPSSRDEDRVAWSTDLEKSGYYATAALVDNGHLYAGSNGFIYELDRASGEILHSAVVGARGIAADYLTTLATDGQTLFAGTHGYVYGISLKTWDTLWDAGVGEHGYHHVSAGCYEGQLFAGCNGHVYRIDRTNGKVVGNIDLGGGDQSLNYNGRYLLAGRDDQIAAIAVPDGLHPSRFEVAWQSDFKINHSNGNPMSSVLMGQRLFAASKQLWDLDPNTGATIGTYGLDYKEGSGDVRLATDGTRIFAGHGDTVDCTQPGRAGWRTSVASLMTEKGVAGHHPVSILMLNGRLFAGCNGYLYELQPNSGVARQWMRPTDLVGVGDYDTRLATDGTDICLGTHGYVYKVELAKR